MNFIFRIKSQKNQIRQFVSNDFDINQAKLKISSQNLRAMMKMANNEEGLFIFFAIFVINLFIKKRKR